MIGILFKTRHIDNTGSIIICKFYTLWDVNISLKNGISSLRNQTNNNLFQTVQNINKNPYTLNSTKIIKSNIQTKINFISNNMIIDNLAISAPSISNFGSQPFPPNVKNAFFTVSSLTPTLTNMNSIG